MEKKGKKKFKWLGWVACMLLIYGAKRWTGYLQAPDEPEDERLQTALATDEKLSYVEGVPLDFKNSDSLQEAVLYYYYLNPDDENRQDFEEEYLTKSAREQLEQTDLAKLPEHVVVDNTQLMCYWEEPADEENDLSFVLDIKDERIVQIYSQGWDEASCEEYREQLGELMEFGRDISTGEAL